MHFYIGITDNQWFRLLSARPELDEVNFWQPSAGKAFRSLTSGEAFLLSCTRAGGDGVPVRPPTTAENAALELMEAALLGPRAGMANRWPRRWIRAMNRCASRKSHPPNLRRHPALVAMMQPADFGKGDDPAAIGSLNRSRFRCVLPQREVLARLVVIRDVAADDPQQLTVVKRHHVVEAFPAQRTDKPFGVTILPRRARGDHHLLKAYSFRAVLEHVAVDSVGSRTTYRSVVVHGNASTTCCAVQAAVG